MLLSGAFSNLKCFLLALIKVLQGGSIALGFGGWNFTKVVPKVTYFPSTHFPDLLRPLLFVFWFNLAPNVNVWGWVGDGSLPPHGALDVRSTQFVGQDLVAPSSPVCATFEFDKVKSCLMWVKQLTLFTPFHAKHQLAQAVENKCINNNVNSRRKSDLHSRCRANSDTGICRDGNQVNPLLRCSSVNADSVWQSGL